MTHHAVCLCFTGFGNVLSINHLAHINVYIFFHQKMILPCWHAGQKFVPFNVAGINWRCDYIYKEVKSRPVLIHSLSMVRPLTTQDTLLSILTISFKYWS